MSLDINNDLRFLQALVVRWAHTDPILAQYGVSPKAGHDTHTLGQRPGDVETHPEEEEHRSHEHEAVP